jgi:hypothetical protein
VVEVGVVLDTVVVVVLVAWLFQPLPHLQLAIFHYRSVAVAVADLEIVKGKTAKHRFLVQ